MADGAPNGAICSPPDTAGSLASGGFQPLPAVLPLSLATEPLWAQILASAVWSPPGAVWCGHVSGNIHRAGRYETGVMIICGKT
jgi:hypothetical protein